MVSSTIDATKFRQVLGNYPTGVTVVTAIADDGSPVGMVIGSFSSVSMDPPLVTYMPAKTSTSYPRLRTAKTFVVNILGSHQEHLSRIVGEKKEDPFAVAAWRLSATGAPIFEGSIAWIECETERVIDAGDHHLVLGRVLDLDTAHPGLPLVFFRGGFGRFSPFSVVAPSQSDITPQIRLAESARAVMEQLAEDLGTEVTASAQVGDHMVTLASAGVPDDATRTWVGLRTPLVPPMGSIYLAWSAPHVADAWLLGAANSADDDERQALRDGLARVRQRGWSMSLLSDATHRLAELHRNIADTGLTPEAEREVRDIMRDAASDYNPQLVDGGRYALRVMNVPIFGPSGDVVLTFQTHGKAGETMTADALRARAEAMRTAAAALTEQIGGRAPELVQS